MTDDRMGSGDDGSDYRPNLGPPLPGESSGTPTSPTPGAPVPPPPAPPAYQAGQYGSPSSATTQDPKALAAVVTGGLSLLFILFCGFLSIPLGIAAIVLGIQGRRQTRAAGVSSAMATIGLVLGVVSLVLTVVFFVVMLLINSTS